MADGDGRDEGRRERQSTGQGAAPGASLGNDARPPQARVVANLGAPRRTIAAATKPLAPASPPAPFAPPPTRRTTAGPQRSAAADGGRMAPAAERAPTRPAAAPARARPGWRRFTPILLGLVAGIALVAVGLAALTIFAPRVAQPQAPSVTTQALCGDLKSQQYGAAYVLLSPHLQTQGTEAQFVASQRELDALQGAVTTCSSTIINVTGGSASAALQVTRAHTPAASGAVTLTLVGAVWRVDAYDTSVI